MLAENGFTKPVFDGTETANALVYLKDEEAESSITTIVVAMANENNSIGCCIFGQELEDSFAGVSVEFEYYQEGLSAVTSADYYFFQGAKLGKMETEYEIIDAIPITPQQISSLVGLTAVEV